MEPNITTPISISVIIPTYNRVALLSRALMSVVAQSYAAQQIIVIDDGSHDNTVQMVSEQFPNVTLISQSNQGVSAARNAGIRAATGEWIALLDSDDSWVENKLAHQVKAINKPEADLSGSMAQNYPLCHTNEIWIRNGRRVNQMKKHEKKGGNIFQHCLSLCVISPSASMIKKSLFEEIGYFDETLPACEDYDLWLRICAKYPVLYVDEPLTVKYGGHDDQLSRQHWGMDRFRIQALKNIIASACLSEDNDRAARAMLHRKCHILQQGAKKHANTKLLDDCQKLMACYPLSAEIV